MEKGADPFCLIHVALRVPDLQPVMHALAELGIAITEGPVTFGDGKTSVFIRDSDRHVVELTQSAIVDSDRKVRSKHV